MKYPLKCRLQISARQFFRPDLGKLEARDAHVVLVGYQDQGAKRGEHDEGKKNLRTPKVYVHTSCS